MAKTNPRQAGLIARMKAAGITHRDAALALGTTANAVTQMLNGYTPLSSSDEKRLDKILQIAEKVRGNK